MESVAAPLLAHGVDGQMAVCADAEGVDGQMEGGVQALDSLEDENPS